jgi:hypothetical protein
VTELVRYVVDAIASEDDDDNVPEIVIAAAQWNASDEIWEYTGDVVAQAEWPYEDDKVGSDLVDVEGVLDEMGWHIVGEVWESTGFGAVTVVEPTNSHT